MNTALEQQVLAVALGLADDAAMRYDAALRKNGVGPRMIASDARRPREVAAVSKRITIGDPKNIARLPPAEHAMNMSAAWLGEHNDAEATHNAKRAEGAYRKSAWWLARYNDIVGNGEGKRRPR